MNHHLLKTRLFVRVFPQNVHFYFIFFAHTRADRRRCARFSPPPHPRRRPCTEAAAVAAAAGAGLRQPGEELFM